MSILQSPCSPLVRRLHTSLQASFDKKDHFSSYTHHFILRFLTLISTRSSNLYNVALPRMENKMEKMEDQLSHCGIEPKKMLDVVIRERYVLDTIRAPGDFAHEKAHEAAGSATLSELPNGDVAFGNPKGFETLAHASQFEEIRKELGDLKQELAKVNEKLRDHDELLEQELAKINEKLRDHDEVRDHDELLKQELAKVNEKLRDHDKLLGDSRKWMAVRNRNFLTFLRHHSKKGSFLSRLANRFGSKQQQQIKEYNKLIHEADMVTDMRMVKMCPESSSEYQDGFNMFDMFKMIYSCSLSVAECLEANRVTYAIKTIDQIANYGLGPECEKRRMSPSQSKAANDLKLYLQKIDPGKGITPEEAQELQNFCDAFQAAKKKNV